MESVALIANGDFHNFDLLIPKVRKCQHIIGVDGGIEYLLQAGIKPHLIVGDFDSASQKTLKHFAEVPKHVLKQDKDETDLEVALDLALQHSPRSIFVFGGLGGRTDHSLYNTYLCARYPGILHFVTEKDAMFCLKQETMLSCRPGQTISLIPLSDEVNHVHSKGLKWELKDARLDRKFMSISNVALQSEVSIRFYSGDLLCVMVESP